MDVSRHPSRKLSTKGRTPPRELEVHNTAVDYEQASVDIFDSAARAVGEMLTKPEQLDNLDQIRMTVARKKVTVETQLRNAVQTQLEGVQNGLELLKDSMHTVGDIKASMTQVEDVYRQCEELSDIIGPIKEVNRRFQQLRITNDHINNIFSVPSVVESIHANIDEGKLLIAHQLLSELEFTRNELLIQLYHSSDAFVDKNTAVHRYFEPLIELSERLSIKIWEVMDNVTDLVGKSSTEVVTVLRIIQREEKADRYIIDSLEEKSIPISQIPNRPKKWRDKCLNHLDTAILAKFSSIEPIMNSEDSNGLQDYLTEVAAISYRDLQAIKSDGVQCFPADYDIMDFFMKRYQICLKKVVADLVAKELNARDIIKLMIWIGDVRQSFRESLDIDLEEHGPLIDQTLEADLQSTCVGQVKWNIDELVKKMLETEKEDWCSHDIPEEDANGCFYTTVGLLLFEMVDQNLSAMAMFGSQTRENVLQTCLSAIEDFQAKYQAEIQSQFDLHIASGRENPPLFFLYMIAIANNCRSCIDFTEQLKARLMAEVDLKRETKIMFDGVCNGFDKLGVNCCEKIVNILFEDLNPLLDQLLTKESWLQSPLALMNKIEGTLLDYNEDLERLKPMHHSTAIVMVQRRVFKTYIQSMMKKKIVLKKKDERNKAASFIKEEARKLGKLFERLSHAASSSYPQVLTDLAELINASTENMPYIIGGITGRCPELKYNHVVAIFAMRGDLTKAQCQKLMERTSLKPNQSSNSLEEFDSDQAKSSGPYSSQAMRSRKRDKSLLIEIVITNPYSLF